jgi:MFS family permease
MFNIKLALLLLMILVGRLLEGAASGMNVPATLGYVTDATSGSTRLRSGMMTAFQVVTIGGMVLAIPFGGKLYSMLDTWGFLVVAGLYALVLVIILVWIVETTPQRQAGQAHSSLLEGLTVIRHKRIFTFLPAWFCVNALVGSWTTLVIIILSYPGPAADARHPGQLLYGGFSKMGASLWVGLFASMFLLGMGLWLFFLPYLRRTTVMLVGLGGLALSIIALTVMNGLAENPLMLAASDKPTLYILLALALLGVLLLSGFTPVALMQMSAIAETLAGKKGAVMGLYSVVLAIGQLLGAGLGGLCVDLKGFYGLMIFSTLMGIFSLASVLYIRSSRDDLITMPVRDNVLIRSTSHD